MPGKTPTDSALIAADGCQSWEYPPSVSCYRAHSVYMDVPHNRFHAEGYSAPSRRRRRRYRTGARTGANAASTVYPFRKEGFGWNSQVLSILQPHFQRAHSPPIVVPRTQGMMRECDCAVRLCQPRKASLDARYSRSCGVLSRPRIALRWGKRPKRRISSR